MLSSAEDVDSPQPDPPSKFDFRVAIAVFLLAVAAGFTWQTIEGLAARRMLRTELAEISHVRYGLLNVGGWLEKIVPILNAKIDALDFRAQDRESLRPAVQNALYRLLDDVKAKMTPKPAAPGSPAPGGLLAGGNALMANLMVGALRPHVPEYTDVVLAELGKAETKNALKKYVRGTLADSAKTTFGNIDMRWYSYILKKHGCTDATACQSVIGNTIAQADDRILLYSSAVLGSSALAFLLLMLGRPVLRRSAVVVLLLFCIVLLVGGVLTPMLEVEAKITRFDMTFMGQPITFGDQVLYFQSKSVLEVFHTLITTGRPDMWIVGVLVLMFSIVFPSLKSITLAACLYRPALLRENRLVRFLALESSKWSMADVMALAIFMAFVAFNGLIVNTMGGLKETGAQLTIPTDSSRLLPGYHLFIGFCLASLFLSKKLERGIRATQALPIP